MRISVWRLIGNRVLFKQIVKFCYFFLTVFILMEKDFVEPKCSAEFNFIFTFVIYFHTCDSPPAAVLILSARLFASTTRLCAGS